MSSLNRLFIFYPLIPHIVFDHLYQVLSFLKLNICPSFLDMVVLETFSTMWVSLLKSDALTSFHASHFLQISAFPMGCQCELYM